MRIIQSVARLLFFIGIAHMVSANEADISFRRNQVIDAMADSTQLHQNPKVGMMQVLASLAATNGQDPKALEYGVNAMDYSANPNADVTKDPYEEIFTYPGLARFLFQYGKHLNEGQKNHLQKRLEDRARDLLDHGTENHAIMRITSGYLFAQYFPEATWTDRAGRKRSSQELKAVCKEKLIERERNFFTYGNAEQLSPTYAIVNIFPLLNLYDFADDPEVKSVANAALLYHVGMIAANDFEGHILPPYNRENLPQAQTGVNHERAAPTIAVTQYVPWFYWGQNFFRPEDLKGGLEPAYSVMLALSQWRPPEIIQHIAQGSGTPYTLRSSIAYFGPWGAGLAGETLRTIYRHADYALGSGVQQYIPDGYFLDYSLFGIAWKSKHRLNYLECLQPYWRSNAGESKWSPATSPFQQQIVHKNTAIVLWDIPAVDPWRNRGEERWRKLRDQHTNALIQSLLCRLPKSFDEIVHHEGWFFFKDADTFIGIRPVGGTAELVTDFSDPMLIDSQMLRLNSNRGGFIFEIGTRREYGSFNKFRSELISHPVTFDRENNDASYQGTTGDLLRLRFNPDRTERKEPLVRNLPMIRAFPHTWINGIAVTYDHWPLAESPVISLRDRVLQFTSSDQRLTVDWQKPIPTVNLQAFP